MRTYVGYALATLLVAGSISLAKSVNAQPGYGYGHMYGGGYGHGPGMMGQGYGYGPGMMGPGYGYGPGMMGPGYGNEARAGRRGGMARCAARFSSFDPQTGTYMTRRGSRARCPFL